MNIKQSLISTLCLAKKSWQHCWKILCLFVVVNFVGGLIAINYYPLLWIALLLFSLLLFLVLFYQVLLLQLGSSAKTLLQLFRYVFNNLISLIFLFIYVVLIPAGCIWTAEVFASGEVYYLIEILIPVAGGIALFILYPAYIYAIAAELLEHRGIFAIERDVYSPVKGRFITFWKVFFPLVVIVGVPTYFLVMLTLNLTGVSIIDIDHVAIILLHVILWIIFALTSLVSVSYFAVWFHDWYSKVEKKRYYRFCQNSVEI
jgi:hypothetical protein